MPRAPRRLQGQRDAAAAWLRDRPATAARLSRTLSAAHATVLAGRVRAVTLPDVVTTTIPGPEGPAPLLMHSIDGRDQSARALQQGWTTFERPMPQVFRRLCDGTSATVVDVGANTGIYALIAQVARKAGSIVAFEPVPAIRTMLSANVALNAGADRVDVRGQAVGSAAGEATLYLPPEVDGGYIETSASLASDFKDEIGTSFTVDVVTLDDWWVGAGRPAVDLLKVDVESRELDVLRGASAMVAASRPYVFYELLPKGDAAGIEAWAAERDLVDVRLRPDEAVIGEAPVFDPDAWNHLFVPRDRLPVARTMLTESRLALTGPLAS